MNVTMQHTDIKENLTPTLRCIEQNKSHPGCPAGRVGFPMQSPSCSALLLTLACGPQMFPLLYVVPLSLPTCLQLSVLSSAVRSHQLKGIQSQQLALSEFFQPHLCDATYHPSSLCGLVSAVSSSILLGSELRFPMIYCYIYNIKLHSSNLIYNHQKCCSFLIFKCF